MDAIEKAREAAAKAFADTLADEGHVIYTDAHAVAMGAFLASLKESGLVVVPVEATEEMLVAGTEAWLCEAAMEDRAGVCWSAMIAAADPTPEQSQRTRE